MSSFNDLCDISTPREALTKLLTLTPADKVASIKEEIRIYELELAIRRLEWTTSTSGDEKVTSDNVKLIEKRWLAEPDPRIRALIAFSLREPPPELAHSIIFNLSAPLILGWKGTSMIFFSTPDLLDEFKKSEEKQELLTLGLIRSLWARGGLSNRTVAYELATLFVAHPRKSIEDKLAVADDVIRWGRPMKKAKFSDLIRLKLLNEAKTKLELNDVPDSWVMEMFSKILVHYTAYVNER